MRETSTLLRYAAGMGVSVDDRIPLWPLTVERYDEMVSAGILDEDDRVELLNGQLSAVSPQSPEHAGLLAWLSTKLIRGVDPEVARVRCRLPIRLALLSEPEPDLAIVAPGVYAHGHPTEAMLVIEMAVSSRGLDLGPKAEIYAAAGVAEYWVIDIRRRTVHVHDAPSARGYGSCRAVTTGSLRPPVPDAPAIDVQALFALLD